MKNKLDIKKIIEELELSADRGSAKLYAVDDATITAIQEAARRERAGLTGVQLTKKQTSRVVESVLEKIKLKNAQSGTIPQPRRSPDSVARLSKLKKLVHIEKKQPLDPTMQSTGIQKGISRKQFQPDLTTPSVKNVTSLIPRTKPKGRLALRKENPKASPQKQPKVLRKGD